MNHGTSKWMDWAAPLAGVAFCLYYIRLATCDIVYDDYIRLVNSYLPDVWDARKFLVPDVLTRIPVNYLGRILNVSFFGYSTMFDMALGALGLGISGFLLAGYCRRRRVGLPACLLSMAVVFSLNKWEMLTNGSGWSHFLAFAAFYYHYLVLDRVAAGEERRGDRARLMWLPFAITLGLSGPYCAIYSATLLLAYAFCLWRSRSGGGRRDWRYLAYGICAVIPLLLYMWSNSYAVYEHAGATDQPFLQTFLDVPGFFARFFIKSFASMVMGEEVMKGLFDARVAAQAPIYLLGLAVMSAYAWALWLNFSRRIYKRTLFPLICLAAGGMNHVLILLSRWIFLNEDYGMSSRYALQFQIGILGIILTFGLAYGALAGAAIGWPRSGHGRSMAGRSGHDESGHGRSMAGRGGYDESGNGQSMAGRSGHGRYWLGGSWLAVAFCLMVLAGNLYTCKKELEKAPYRREYYERRVEAALGFEGLDDATLSEVFDYRKSEAGSGAKVRQALTTLRDHGWNVYGD